MMLSQRLLALGSVFITAMIFASCSGGSIDFRNPVVVQQATPTPTPTYIAQSSNLVNGMISVKAGNYYYLPFTIDTSYMTNAAVVGSFQASGGSGNDIVVLILDGMGFTNWTNGHQTNTYYNSGQVTVGNINSAMTASGQYYLVFSNKFSTFSTKSVNTTVNLTWSQLEYH